MAKFNTVLDEEGQRRRESLASYAANTGSILDANERGVQRNNNEFQRGIDSGLVTRVNANLANKDRMERLNAVTNWELARANAAQRNGTEYSGPSPAFEQATRAGGFPPRQVNNVPAPQQNAAQPQRTTTGGGQAIAAENPDQQTAAAPRQTTTGNGVENYTAGGLNFARSKNERGETVLAATDGSGGTARAVLHGGGNQQQSRPGLGLNGMRDLGNGQVAVGQVDGFQNPGYGFKGSREDAARFFQPVPHGGGYNPYKQSFRTLFDEQMDARQRQRERPAMANMPEAPEGGWQTKLGAYKAQLDFLKNQNQAQLGYDTAAANRALQQQQMAQQYGFNMAQLGNDAMRTQAALGLSGLQQQQAMQQMRQQQMLDSARYTLATADPNSEEYKRAERVAKTFGSNGKNGQDEKQTKIHWGQDAEGNTTASWIGEDGMPYTQQAQQRAGQSGSDLGGIINNLIQQDPKNGVRQAAALMARFEKADPETQKRMIAELKKAGA